MAILWVFRRLANESKIHFKCVRIIAASDCNLTDAYRIDRTGRHPTASSEGGKEKGVDHKPGSVVDNHSSGICVATDL